MFADVRFALRSLARRPLFTLTIALTLALGIGANTAIFSVLRAMLLRPLPYQAPEQLMVVWGQYPEFGHTSTSLPDYLDWRAMSRRFSSLAAVTVTGYNVSGEGAPERAQAALATSNLLRTLGLVPVLGRDLRPDDERGTPSAVLLGWDYWQRRYGGARDVVGRTLQLNGRPYTIVGVAPRALAFPARTDLLVPLKTDTTLNRRSEFLDVVGRLAPGATPEAAQAEMATIATRLAAEYPETNATIRADVVPLGEQLLGKARPAVLTLMGAVALVLLVACGNVANLLLGRAAERERELAVRAGLGASRVRLARQMVTESLVLALGGGALGLGLAAGAVRLLRAAPSDVLPRLDEVRLDPWVAVFAFGVSVLCGLLFGVAPAMRAGRADLQGTLRAGGRGLAGQGAVLRLRALLIGSEVALAVVLLVVGALLLRSFGELQRVPTGFVAERVLTAKVTLPRARYPDGARLVAFWDGVQGRVTTFPGVRAAGIGSSVPMGAVPYLSFEIEGVPQTGTNVMQDAQAYNVSPGYFPALGIRLVRGRLLAPSDGPDAPRVLVINETLARRFFGARDPIGARITFGDSTEYATVVGIVADMRQRGLADAPYSQAYAPVAQEPGRSMYLTLRTTGDPTGLAAAVRRAVAELDPALPVYDVRSMEDRLADDVARPRFTSALTTAFALMALLLAAVGISGVVAYAVGQRTRELGVRQALGARPEDVVRLVVRQGMTPVVVGIAVGLVGAAAAARAIRGLLFGVGAADPVTYVGALAFLGTVALVATWLPARRALRVPPAVALVAD